jgi:hypothetical protein
MNYIKENVSSVSPELKMAAMIEEEMLTEDRFSYCPAYSVKQLRRINELKIGKSKYGHGNVINRRYPVRKQVSLQGAFNQEAILQ